jgi:hypothetical protein
MSGRSVTALAVLSPSRLHRRVARILHLRSVAAPRPWRGVSVFSAAALAAFTVVIAHVEVAAFSAESTVISTAAPAAQLRVLAADVGVPARPAAPAVRSTAEPREPGRSPIVTTGPAVRAQEPLPSVTEVRAIETASQSAGTPVPVLESGSHRGLPLSAPAVAQSFERATDSFGEDQRLAPWTRAADTGIAVGRASQDAGVATAGFFTRFGKRVAGSF